MIKTNHIDKLSSDCVNSNQSVNHEEIGDGKTWFEIINKSENEDTHTEFLKWYFDKTKEDSVRVLLSLVRKIDERSRQQNKTKEFPVNIYKAENLKLVDIKSQDNITGIRVNNHAKGGKSDLMILCEVKNRNDETINYLRIIIENKINSNENNHQTWLYYCYYSGDFDNCPSDIDIRPQKYNTKKRKAYNFKKIENEEQIYVYLKHNSDEEMDEFYPADNPHKPQCKCSHYIHITYQDLLESIFSKIDDLRLDNRDKFFINEYVETVKKLYKYRLTCKTGS